MVGTTYELIVEQTVLLKQYAEALKSGGEGEEQMNQLVGCLEDWQCLFGGAIFSSMRKFLEGLMIAARANIKGRQCDLTYYYGNLHQGMYMLSDYFANYGTVREDFLREWGIYSNDVIHVMLTDADVAICEKSISLAAAVIEFNVCNYMDDPIWPVGSDFCCSVQDDVLLPGMAQRERPIAQLNEMAEQTSGQRRNRRNRSRRGGSPRRSRR